LRLRPDGAFARDNRGLAGYEKGEYARAVDDFNESLRLIPDDGYAEAGCV
jgi:hypothetical protein